jgi:tetratricopeptide (TPR) repeat protein
MRVLIVFGLVAALAGGFEPAAAQDAPRGEIIFDVPPPPRPPADAGLVQQDTLIYDRAVQAKSLAELAKFERELKLVLDHVPTRFPLFETRRGQVTVRADRETGGPIAKAMAAELLKANPETSVRISFEPNVYGFAALSVGALAAERKDYATALMALNAGASVQPDNPKILAQRGYALAMLGRLPEAMSLLLTWRRDYRLQAQLSPSDTAAVLRAIGFVMTEQKRYPDAQASYEDSLKLEPGDATALSALKRITQLRTGVAP